MPKQKKNDDLFAELAEDFGGEVLNAIPPVKFFVDTGNLALNYICSGKFMGGGVPAGKIIELYGPESSGKSLWGMNILRGTQAIGGIPVHLDCENAVNSEFAAKASHIDLSKIVRFAPDCLEAVFAKIFNIIRKVREKDTERPLVFVYDSIAVSPSERELRETTVSENPTPTEWKQKVGSKEQPGERAKIINRELRKLEALLEKNNATLVVMNQTRKKIGVFMGSDETTTSGEALKFYAGLRLRTSTQKKIDNKKLGTLIGVNLKIKNVKNRIFRPFAEVEGVQLYFEKGVNPLSGLLTCLEQAERIEKVSNGVYKVLEPWAAGQEIKFRGSKARNDVDAETLLKCPALIDAKDEQEVKDYLALFGEAIDQGMSEDVEEIDVERGEGEFMD